MSSITRTVNGVKRWTLMAAGEAVTMVAMGMVKVPAGAAEAQVQVQHCGWGQSITSCSTISTSTVASATVGSTPSVWGPPSTRTEKDMLKEGKSWRWSHFLLGEEVQMKIAAIIRLLTLRAWGHCSGDSMGGWTIRPFCHPLYAATAARRRHRTQSSVGPAPSSIHQTTQHLNTQRRWKSFTSSWDSTVRKHNHCTQTDDQVAVKLKRLHLTLSAPVQTYKKNWTKPSMTSSLDFWRVVLEINLQSSSADHIDWKWLCRTPCKVKNGQMGEWNKSDRLLYALSLLQLLQNSNFRLPWLMLTYDFN